MISEEEHNRLGALWVAERERADRMWDLYQVAEARARDNYAELKRYERVVGLIT